MNRTKKIALTATLGLILFCVGIPIVQASQGVWSGEVVFNVNAGHIWGNPSVTTNRKQTISHNWDLQVLARTMGSRPHVRLSTSSGVARSAYLSAPDDWIIQMGSGNTANVGDDVHVQVRPAINQVTNNQTLRFRYRAR